MGRVSALLLSWLLVLDGAPPKLTIVILEGQGAVNNVRQRTAHEPIVAIRDKDNRPVAGASVTFLLPESGPSGVFPNGSHITTTVSDEKGQAAGLGLRPNRVAGGFQIRVTASHQGQTASASISQTNVGSPPSRVPGKLIAVAALAGGAVTGVVIARRGGPGGATSGKAARPTIIPGTPEVGRPQ